MSEAKKSMVNKFDHFLVIRNMDQAVTYWNDRTGWDVLSSADMHPILRDAGASLPDLPGGGRWISLAEAVTGMSEDASSGFALVRSLIRAESIAIASDFSRATVRKS